MSIYICTICNQQKDSDFNCAELDGKECCEECFEENNSEAAYERYLDGYYGGSGHWLLTKNISKFMKNMNIKDEIKKLELELLKFKTIMSHDGAQQEVRRLKIALKESLTINNKLMEVVETQQEAIEETIKTANNYYPNTDDALKYSIQIISSALEKSKQLLEGE